MGLFSRGQRRREAYDDEQPKRRNREKERQYRDYSPERSSPADQRSYRSDADMARRLQNEEYEAGKAYDDEQPKQRNRNKERHYRENLPERSSPADPSSDRSDADMARRLQAEEYEAGEAKEQKTPQIRTMVPYRGKGKEPALRSYDGNDRSSYVHSKSLAQRREPSRQVLPHERDRSKISPSIYSTERSDVRTSDKNNTLHRDVVQSADPGFRDKPSKESTSNKQLARPLTLTQEIEIVRQYGQSAKRVGCRKCENRLIGTSNPCLHADMWMWDAHVRAPATDGDHLLCAFLCVRCEAYTCAGCGRRPNGKTSSFEVDELSISWCCEPSRIFSIWAILCWYDEHIHDHNQAVQSAPKTSELTAKAGKSGGQGTGFVRQFRKIQSSRDGSLDSRAPWENQVSCENQASCENQVDRARSDEVTQQTMELITVLLNGTGRAESDSFHKPLQQQVSAMLKCSLILDQAAELARNDSIEDATQRYELYIALLGFIRAIWRHENTRHLVHNDREIKRQTSGLQMISFKGVEAVSLADSKDTASSIESRLRDLVAQAQAVIEGATNVSGKSLTKQGSQNDDMMMNLCQHLCHTAKKIGMVSTQSLVLGSSQNVRSAWEKYEKVNHLTYVEDKDIIDSSVYQYFDRLSAQGAPKRMQRIIGECATMKTSLPPGVFVKACMSRPDVMKALIIGPPDTPYEGGIFEFDILLPGEYPSVPPKLHFRTPKWQADFNPNIHPKSKLGHLQGALEFEAMGLMGTTGQDMAVCLSLLNTWPGEPHEQWQPNQSTLLQVLICIQSMVFVPEPYFNEPGTDPRDAKMRDYSERYSKIREPMTVFYGMLLWLRDPERKDGIWKEVVREYFKANADRLVKVVRKWAKRNEEITRWQGYVTSAMGAFGSIVEQKGKGKNLLAELEASLAPYRELG